MPLDFIAGGKPPIVLLWQLALLAAALTVLPSCSSETEFASGPGKAPPIQPQEDPQPQGDNALPENPQASDGETTAPGSNQDDTIDTTTELGVAAVQSRALGFSLHPGRRQRRGHVRK